MAKTISDTVGYLEDVKNKGEQIERMQKVKLPMRDYLSNIKGLQNDPDIPYISNNLVYIAKGDKFEEIDRDILYSILDRDPKKADAYWFISVNTTDNPFQREYEVNTLGTDFIFRVNLNLGFKVRQSVNIYLRQIVNDLMKTGELPPQSKDYSIYGPSAVGSENGIPSSIRSAPFFTAALTTAAVVSKSGSPQVINGINAFPFSKAFLILLINILPSVSRDSGNILIASARNRYYDYLVLIHFGSYFHSVR